MKRIDTNKLEKLPNGSGSSATCYILNSRYLIKEIDNFLYFPEDNIRLLKGVKNDTFIYPVDYYAEDGSALQFKLRYIRNAFSLYSMRNNVSIDRFSSLIAKVYEDVKRVSELGIGLHDVWSGNILFNGKRLYFIDREEDQVLDTTYENVLSYNLFSINRCFYYYLLGDLSTSGLIGNVLEDNRITRELTKMIFSEKNDCFILKDFLQEYKKVLNDFLCVDEDNLGNIFARVRKIK